jgi:acid phosphatase
VIAVFENKGYDQIIGSSQAPYLNRVAGQGALFTDSHAVTHPSQPNYIALFSGSTQGITNDSCPHDLPTTANLGSQLAGAGLSFVGYSEELPWPGYRGCSNGTSYARKHAPWVDFTAVPASANRSLSDLPTDFRRLPTVSFVVPNLCNDMHDCPVSTGDSWAAAHLDGYLRWAQSNRGLLIVTFDENDGSPGNRILTMVAGAGVRTGLRSESINHYTVLRTIENLFGLAPLGEAARTPPIADLLNPG